MGQRGKIESCYGTIPPYTEFKKIITQTKDPGGYLYWTPEPTPLTLGEASVSLGEQPRQRSVLKGIVPWVNSRASGLS